MISLFSCLFRKQNKIRNHHFSSYSEKEKSQPGESERGIRIAVYDSLGAIPRIMDIRSDHDGELLDKVSSKTYSFAQDKGGSVPYIAIK